MVKINVLGKPFGQNVMLQTVKDASKFMVNLLFRDAMDVCDSLTIDIELEQGLETAGSCDWKYEPRNPIDFIVQLDADMNRIPFLKSLGHELAHVRQMAMGWKTMSLDGTKHRWMGQLIDHETTDYYDLPWEIEAHGIEYGLYDRFERHLAGVATKPLNEQSAIAHLQVATMIGDIGLG